MLRGAGAWPARAAAPAMTWSTAAARDARTSICAYQQTREMLASAAMVGRLGLRAVVAPAATWHAAKRGSKVRCHARWQVPGSICVWQIYGSTCRNETRATSTRRARLRTSGWHAPRAPVAMPAWCPCSTLLRARRRARPPRPPAGWCDCPVILVRPASVSAPTELATKSLQYRSSVSPAECWEPSCSVT